MQMVPFYTKLIKKNDNSIIIAHLPTERNLYGQHPLKESKNLFKSSIVNGLVKNGIDHNRDSRMVPVTFASL